VHRFISTNDNCTSAMMSAMTDPSLSDFLNPDPPPTNKIIQEELLLKSYSTKGSNFSNGSSPDAGDDINSPASATGNMPDSDANDHLLLSRKYQTHNDMMKYVYEYASAKGFFPLHCVKGFFNPQLFKKYFPPLTSNIHIHWDQALLIQG
jgi:hypothetical protein